MSYIPSEREHLESVWADRVAQLIAAHAKRNGVQPRSVVNQIAKLHQREQPEDTSERDGIVAQLLKRLESRQ